MTAPAFNTTVTSNHLSKKLLPVLTGKLLPVLFLTIILIMYSRKLSYSEYGSFQSVWIYTNIVSVIISFGLSSVILSTNIQFINSFFKQYRSRLLLLYSTGALLSFIVFYFTTFFDTATKGLLIVFILLQCICTITDTLLVKNNALGVYVWVNFCYTLVFFVIHLYFYYQPFVLNNLVAAIVCLALVKAAFIFYAVKKISVGKPALPPANFVRNWVFIGLNEVAGIVVKWLDKLFLLYLLSPAEFAIFFNGSFEIPLFGILISALEYIMLTNISANITDREGAKNIFRESFKILSLVAFPLFFFLLVMHSEGFAIVFDNKYTASIPVFLVSILIIPVRINHYGVLLQCYGQSHKIVLGSLIDIAISLLLMIVLFPWLGTTGVAMSIVVSTWLQAGYYLWQSADLMRVRMDAIVPIAFLVKLFCLLATVYGILYYLKQYVSPVVSLVAMFILTSLVIITGLLLYWKRHQRTNQLLVNTRPA